VTVSSHLDPAGLEIWWAALGGGLVVIACVVTLLSLLTAFVHDIKRHLLAASENAQGISDRLGATRLIGDAADLIHDLGDELAMQVAVVARSGGGTG